LEEVVVVVQMEVIHLSLSAELLIVLQVVDVEEYILIALQLLHNQEVLVVELETIHLVLKVVVMLVVIAHQKVILEELELMLHLHMEQVAEVDTEQLVVTDQVQKVVMVEQEQM
jgi:hypothetical protein